MDLLDRYLAAIAALLPRGQREDIVAELRDTLIGRVEDKERQTGRSLDKTELEALLRAFGHPLAVAGRYGPQRALIGVELYPFYSFAVKVALALAAFVAVIPAVVGVVTDEGNVARAISRAIHDFIPSALTLIGLATVVGGAIERGWIKTGDFGQWKVGDLPHLSSKVRFFQPTRFEALFEMVVMVMFALWWAGWIRLPVGLGPFGRDEGLQVVLAPVLTHLHLPILLLAIGQALSALIVVARPAWIAPRAVAEIVLSLAGIALAAALWHQLPLFVFVGTGASVEGAVALQATVDNLMKGCILVTVAICAGKILIESWRLARLKKG